MSKLPAVKSPFPLCSGEIATAGFLSKSEKHFHCMASLTRSTFICSTLRAAWFFVVSLRGPQNISNFWGEEEVRLLYTKRVLLVATSHFRRSEARVFVSSQSNAVNGCRLAKLNNKGDVSALTIAIRGQLRSGRVGRMPSERGLRVFD